MAFAALRFMSSARVDDDDAPAPLARRGAEERRDLADGIDGKLGAVALVALVPVALQVEQVAVCAGRQPMRGRMLGRHEKVARGENLRRRGIGMREEEAREAEGERRLADAALAGENPAVMHAAGAVGFEERRLRRLMPDEDRRLARQCDAVERVVGRTLLLELRCARHLGQPFALPGFSRSATAF